MEPKKERYFQFYLKSAQKAIDLMRQQHRPATAATSATVPPEGKVYRNVNRTFYGTNSSEKSLNLAKSSSLSNQQMYGDRPKSGDDNSPTANSEVQMKSLNDGY